MVWDGELGRNLGSRYKVNPFAYTGRSPSQDHGGAPKRSALGSGPRGQEPRIVTFDISDHTSTKSWAEPKRTTRTRPYSGNTFTKSRAEPKRSTRTRPCSGPRGQERVKLN